MGVQVARGDRCSLFSSIYFIILFSLPCGYLVYCGLFRLFYYSSLYFMFLPSFVLLVYVTYRFGCPLIFMGFVFPSVLCFSWEFGLRLHAGYLVDEDYPCRVQVMKQPRGVKCE